MSKNEATEMNVNEMHVPKNVDVELSYLMSVIYEMGSVQSITNYEIRFE